MIDIALIGSGFAAETHADRYQSLDGVRVTAVVAPNTADAFVAERDLDATPYDSLTTALRDEQVDAADICAPTHHHRSVVDTVADHGLDFLCEKPLAPTIADAQAIEDAAGTAGVTAMVGHVVRFFPAYRSIADRVESGAVGDPGSVRTRRLSPIPDWADWFTDDAKSGGVFLDLGIHDFDFLRWLVGPVDRVFARRTRWDGGQNGHATVRFADGTVGYVEAGWDRPDEGELRTTIEIAGDGGLIEYDSTDPSPFVVRTDEGTTAPSEAVKRDGFARELEAFAECIRSGDEPPVGIDEAIDAMRIALAANRSAKTGEPVAPAEVDA